MPLHLDRLPLQIEPQMLADRRPVRKHARQHLQRGGFARAIRAQKTDNLPGGNLERQYHPRLSGRQSAWSVG